MPQQRDVAVALLHQAAHLLHDGLRLARDLPPPRVGHNAVRAEVVAAVHHRDPRPHRRLPPHRKPLGNGRGLAFDKGLARPSRQRREHRLGKTEKGAGAQDKVNLRIFFEHLLHPVRLLHHAAGNAQHKARVLGLPGLERPHVAKHLELGVLAHGAGVEHDQVGLLTVGRRRKAHLLEHAAHAVGVGLVLLASVCFNQGGAASARSGIFRVKQAAHLFDAAALRLERRAVNGFDHCAPPVRDPCRYFDNSLYQEAALFASGAPQKKTKKRACRRLLRPPPTQRSNPPLCTPRPGRGIWDVRTKKARILPIQSLQLTGKPVILISTEFFERGDPFDCPGKNQSQNSNS